MNYYCVYKHTSPNNKVYIGITSRNPETRWKNGYGYSSNKHLTSAIQKYGWDNFQHEILFENLTREEACQKEIDLIKFYDSTNPDKGYNHSLGGDSGTTGLVVSEEVRQKLRENHADVSGKNNPMYGKHLSDETKRKISEALKGEKSPQYGVVYSEEQRQHLSEASPLRKPVVQMSLDGKIVSEFHGVREAGRITGIAYQSISACCKGAKKTAGGFLWKYKDGNIINCLMQTAGSAPVPATN